MDKKIKSRFSNELVSLINEFSKQASFDKKRQKDER
jgi:hypothetical protein